MRFPVALPLLLASLSLSFVAAAAPEQCLRPPALDGASPGSSELVYSKLFAEAITVAGLGVEYEPAAEHTLGIVSGGSVWAYVGDVAGCILTFGHVSRADWDEAKRLTFPAPTSEGPTLTLRGQDEIIPDFKRKQPGGPS
jgi:hypothetical protein